MTEIKRKTAETDIDLSFAMYGEGKHDVETGCGFLDHMLTLFAVHGGFDLAVKCKGDTEVDCHHTAEDIGICLGDAFARELDVRGIARYGDITLPMDETLVLCAVDLCGRPYFSWDAEFTVPKIGDFETEMVKEFFYAVSYSAAMNLHIKVLTAGNNHHMAEAMFKAFAKALDEATMVDSRITDILSTKGSL